MSACRPHLAPIVATRRHLSPCRSAVPSVSDRLRSGSGQNICTMCVLEICYNGNRPLPLQCTCRRSASSYCSLSCEMLVQRMQHFPAAVVTGLRYTPPAAACRMCLLPLAFDREYKPSKTTQKHHKTTMKLLKTMQKHHKNTIKTQYRDEPSASKTGRKHSKTCKNMSKTARCVVSYRRKTRPKQGLQKGEDREPPSCNPTTVATRDNRFSICCATSACHLSSRSAPRNISHL